MTGGSGFTGHFLISKAEELGYEVFVLESDLREYSALKNEIHKISPQNVIHLAGISFLQHKNISEIYDVNLIGTLNLMESLSTLPELPKKIIVASSANVYGESLNSPISEGEMPNPINHYGISKYAMERVTLTYRDKISVIIARCFNYTGVGQSMDFLVPKLIYHYKNNISQIKLGNLVVEREFNDVRMVVSIYLSLLEKGESGEIYNVCSGKAYSIQAILELLTKLTNHLPEIEKNLDFIRTNELLSLRGNPQKLVNRIGELPDYSIEETLRWMLSSKI